MGYQKSVSSSSIELLIDSLNKNQVSDPYGNIPAVYKANKAIIDNVAQAEWSMVDSEGEEIDKYPEVVSLFANAYLDNGQKLTKVECLQHMAGHLGLYGEVFIVKNIENEGQRVGISLPNSITLVAPPNMTEITNGNRLTGWQINSSYITRLLNLEDVIHIKDFSAKSCVRGTSPLKVLMDELRIETQVSEHIWSLFTNGAVPSLLLQTDKTLSPEQKDQLRKAWAARHQGSKNSGKFAVLDGGMTATTLAQTNVDMQLAEIIRYAEEKIIGLWRVPKAMFGYTDNLNRATFLGQLNVFWTMTLIPMLDKILDVINERLVLPYTSNKAMLHFDLSNVEALQEVLWDKIDIAVKLQTLGFTRNEINDRLGLGFAENTDWGDDWYIPFSLTPANDKSELLEPKNTDIPKAVTKEMVEVNGRSYTTKQVEYIKTMNKLHDRLHIQFRKAINDYFMSLRKRVLDTFDDEFKGFANVEQKQVSININWGKEEDIFKEYIEQWEAEAIAQGIRAGTTLTGVKPSEEIKYRANAKTMQRLEFVAKSACKTTAEQLNKEINEGIDNNESTNQIKDRLKKYFGKATNRANTIARTEITAQLNAGTIMQYEDIGVEKKEWLTNIDGFERDEHAEANHQVVDLKDSFFVGGEHMEAPAMGIKPRNNINCRCFVLPVEK